MQNKFIIPSWKSYQHYKDRNPPWIKLHYELLSSRAWVALDDASRVLAVACMLIASRNDGGIPDDDAYVQRVAYLNKKPNYKPLIDCGFIEHASTMLADASNLHTNARPETETETYREETEKRESHKARATQLSQDWVLPEEWGVWAEQFNLTTEQIVTEGQKFKDYWHSTGKTKVDWQATWRNWIRTALERKK